MPFISASIMLQLLTAVIPQLGKLSREDGGRQKIMQYTRYATIGLCIFQAIAMALYARRDTGRGRYIDASLLAGAAGLQTVRMIEHVISGGAPSPHPIQGIGAGFIPKILKKELLDGVIQVEHTDAYDFARRAAKEEGMFIGVSSGASLAAVKQKLPELPKGSRVLTFCYDTGERYLSVDGFLP
jgi:crotonobetainyl-CoA:carnitine CoA-transferase CaiB-like acyl-CoA transferase